jgi:hypothetical protein
VSTTHERPPDAKALEAPPDGLHLSSDELTLATLSTDESTPALTLGSLPVGARLILRCRADWRTAAVAGFEPERGRVVLSVASPGGHTYRVRRPHDAPLAHDGHLPVLGEGQWRAGLARYDVRG